MDDTRRDEGKPATPADHYDPAATGPLPGNPDRSATGQRPGAVSTDDGRRPPALTPEPRRRSGGAGKWVLLLAVVAAAVIGGLLWKRSGAHEQLVKETRDLSVVHVSVTHPSEGPSEDQITLPGNLQAFNEAPIFARTSGYLKAWYTDIGAQVKEGQVLADVEAPDVDAQLRQANANLSQARANLEIANLNYNRQKDLLQKKVASQQEFDQNRTNVEAMKAAVQAGEAAVQNLTVQKNFQQLKSPFDGVVTRRSTDVGALISAANGQELFRVARIDILRVYVYVPQAYAAFVQVGSRAFLELTEFPGEKFEGEVANIAGAIDATTRTLQTEVRVVNKNGRLFPGAFANVRLSLPTKQKPMVIPVNTMLFRKEGAQVAVVDGGGVVHLKSVTIGHDYGTTLEVTSGVTRAERIIINPPDSLADGAKVEVEEAKMPAPKVG